MLMSEREPWCQRSWTKPEDREVGIPLETLTSDMEPCHLRVSLLEALPLEVVTTLSRPSRDEPSSQEVRGLCETASLSLRNLQVQGGGVGDRGSPFSKGATFYCALRTAIIKGT
jgi:hypothetical protein